MTPAAEKHGSKIIDRRDGNARQSATKGDCRTSGRQSVCQRGGDPRRYAAFHRRGDARRRSAAGVIGAFMNLLASRNGINANPSRNKARNRREGIKRHSVLKQKRAYAHREKSAGMAQENLRHITGPESSASTSPARKSLRNSCHVL